MLAASVMYPIRGAVTWKSTVGTNVASDALANLASGGVTGGALIIVGEDYGEGSSIMQERSHAFAMKSQIWLLDPRPNLPIDRQGGGGRLSSCRRRRNTPVMLEVRIRACHVHGRFIAKDNKRPAIHAGARRWKIRAATPAASCCRRPPSCTRRRRSSSAGRPRSSSSGSAGSTRSSAGDIDEIGIILQGGMYNGVIRALQRLGLADVWGNTRIPLYVLNVTYPLIDDEVDRLLRAASARC